MCVRAGVCVGVRECVGAGVCGIAGVHTQLVKTKVYSLFIN